MRIDEFLGHFEGVQKRGTHQWQAKCPAHYDDNPSLSIKDAGDRILVHCHAGCEYTDILEAVGLTIEDVGGRLTVEEAFAEAPPWRKEIEAEYRYTDEDGKYLYSKLRYPGKVIRYGIAKGTELVPGRRNVPKTLYRLPQLIKAVKKGEPVYYCEGEKDVDTMTRLGLTATTAGGAQDWKREYASYFTGARVTILSDNDEAGKKLASRVANDLKNFAHSIKVVNPSNKYKGDVTDYIEEGHTVEELKALIKRAPHTATAKNGKLEPVKGPPGKLISHSAEGLRELNLKPPTFWVKNLIPQGVGILSAKSKLGKSWLCLDMAISVATGEPFLDRATKQAGVLYMALEDSLYRLDDRLNKMLGSEKRPENLHMVIQSERVGSGLVEQIKMFLDERPDVKLIIIDTLQMIRESRGNKDAYEHDYETMAKLREVTKDTDIGVLLVHHTRKANGMDGDPFDEILGSTALMGATDYAIVLKKPPGEEIAVMHAKGRDFFTEDIALEFNNTTHRWESRGEIRTLETMRAELEYKTHPVVITLKHKLEQIQKDPEEGLKKYVVRMQDFRNDVIEHTGEVIGTSNRNFLTIIKAFDPWLLKDGIRHLYPGEGAPSAWKGTKNTRYHCYEYTKDIASNDLKTK